MGPQLLKRNPSRRINVQGQLRNASFFGDEFQTTQNDHHVTFLILNQEKDKDVTTRCPDKFSKISQFSRNFLIFVTLKNILKILKKYFGIFDTLKKSFGFFGDSKKYFGIFENIIKIIRNF